MRLSKLNVVLAMAAAGFLSAAATIAPPTPTQARGDDWFQCVRDNRDACAAQCIALGYTPGDLQFLPCRTQCEQAICGEPHG